jgi:thiamine biosynthesis lipoprotein
MSTRERTIEVMGTTAHLIVIDAPVAALDQAAGRLAELERRWSRFRPDSEVSHLNELSGVPVAVSADTFTLVQTALAAVRLTDGRFDPTLLAELRDAGYDRSFELLDATAGSRRDATAERFRPPHRSPLDAIHIDTVVRTIRLDPGTAFDPGGIGKGLAADLVVDELLARGVRGALVNVGGDLAAAGDVPHPSGWVVAVTDPQDEAHVIATLRLGRGAVATSWRTKRAWIRDGTPQHHLIDPRTGRPAATGLAGVTVIAGRGWQAEALAKSAFLAGAERAEDVLAANGATGLLFLDDGSTEPLRGLDDFLA